ITETWKASYELSNSNDEILHRDLSLWNFKCYAVNGKSIAVLIDYDLSAVLMHLEENRVATSKHRTGTTPFMARELLKKPPDGVVVRHIFAHELESWLYTLVHVLLGYTNDTPEGDPLRNWALSDWDRVHIEKNDFFNEGVDEVLLEVSVLI